MIIWKNKIKEWLERYSLPLILATLAAIIFASVSKFLTGNNIISGIFATLIDAIVFYGYIAIMDLRRDNSERPKLKKFLKQIRNMIVEFGPAEYLDSFLIKPLYLSSFPYFIDNYQIAILLGSIAAEFTYFLPVIILYELRKKVFKN